MRVEELQTCVSMTYRVTTTLKTDEDRMRVPVGFAFREVAAV